MSTCVNDHLFLSVAVYRDARHLFTKTFPQSSRFYQATLPKGKAATTLPRQTSLRTPAPAHLPRGPHTLAPGEALPGPGRLQPATGTSVSNPSPAHPSTVWVTAVTSPAPHTLAVRLWPAPRLQPCGDAGLCLVRPPASGASAVSPLNSTFPTV